MVKIAFIAVLAMALELVASGAQAQVGADLNISPKRVTLGEGKRSATVYIFNQGDEAATYTVEMVDRIMSTDGEIVAVGDQTPKLNASAHDLLQYTPRRVTLQAKQSQSIRIRVLRPSGPGEYRSHLTVTALPSEDMGLTAAAAAGPEGDGLAVKVVALFSISIPVIIREGPMEAVATIENAKVNAVSTPGEPTRVRLDLVRSGVGSIYGDVEVYARRGRDERRIGFVRGVAVYPEIDRRAFVVELTEPVRHGERLRVVYRDDDARPGAERATASFVAP
jgi:hypothetical protein